MATVFRNSHTVSSPIVVLSSMADKAVRLATQDYNEYADESASIFAPGIEAQLKGRPQKTDRKRDRSSRNTHPSRLLPELIDDARFLASDLRSRSHSDSNYDISQNPRTSATGLYGKFKKLGSSGFSSRSVPHSLLHLDAHSDLHSHFSEDTRMSSGLYQPPEFSVFLGQAKSPAIPQFARRSGQVYNAEHLRSGRQATCWSGKACGADVIPSPSQYMAQNMAQIANPKKSRVARSRLFRGVMYGDANPNP